MLQRPAGIVLLVLAASCARADAQQPTPQPPTPQSPPPFPPAPGPPGPPAGPVNVGGAYRAPAIALVQPAAGGTVPQDRPVVVFRFGQGEPTDPIDVRSFAVSVDDEDRTALFQVVAGEAWGPLARGGSGEKPIALGAHHVAARICSTRGACAAASATVTVAPDQAAAASGIPPRPAQVATRRQRIIDLVLQAARRLLTP